MLFKALEINNSIGIIIYYMALVMTLFSLVMYFREFYVKGYFKKETLKMNEIINKEQK